MVTNRPVPCSRTDVGRTFERAEHHRDAAVLAQVRDGLGAARSDVEVRDRVIVDDHEGAVDAFGREVDATVASTRCGGHEEHPLPLDERAQSVVDPRVDLAHLLPADRAVRGRSDQLAVLRQHSGRVLRGRRLPADLRRSISSSSTSSSSVRLAASRRMRSPARTNAIGPASTASGATWPTQNPVVPPENRPSVRSMTSLPSPAPLIAPVIASISRIPGPPLGPS